MRFNGVAVLVVAAAMLACGGGEKAAETAETPATPAVDANAGAAPAAAMTAAPITGTIHEVKMLLDAAGTYKFEPNALTIKTGDGVKFVNVSGGPHNVAFDAATVPEDVKGQLMANLPNTQGNMDSPMMMQPMEAWTASFGNIKAGTYGVICTPHLAMGMKMDIVVQ